MSTYGKTVSAAAQGATADQFDSVGSITIPSYASHIHGFMVSFAESVRTAGEAILAQVRWSASDFSIGNQIFQLPTGSGGAPATNIAPIGRKQYLRNVDIPIEGQGDLTFEVSTHLPDPTAGIDIGIGVLFNDGLDNAYQQFFPMPMPSVGSDSESNAAITATTLASITNLDVQSWARRITQFDFAIAPDAAITAGDPIVPSTELSSSFKEFLDQDYVLPSASGILGTPVGDGFVVEGMDIPVDIPFTSGAKETITPKIKLTTTSATSIAIAAGVGWRGES